MFGEPVLYVYAVHRIKTICLFLYFYAYILHENNISKKTFQIKKCLKNVSFSPLTIDLKVEEYQTLSKINNQIDTRGPD